MKSKTVKGTKFSAVDEIRDKRINTFEGLYSSAGISDALMMAKMDPSSCNILKVKPQKKNAKLTSTKTKYLG